MGRPRVLMAQQKGNLTVLEQIEKKQEEAAASVGREQLAKPPAWLTDKTARNEYRRLIKEFEQLKVIGNLDINNIAGYCLAYSFYRKATEELVGQPLVLKKEKADGTDVIFENPLVKIQKNYADEMRKFGALCGLTIDSRLKIGTVILTKQEDSIRNKFGDI